MNPFEKEGLFPSDDCADRDADRYCRTRNSRGAAMKMISLFSGIGGFDLAAEHAGMVVDTVCEIDKRAQAVLQRHFSGSKLVIDVREVGVNTHERKAIDVVTGGFPCQDVSIAGKREGLAGKRSGLWFEFARIIDELEPRWVVIENVPGLLSSNGGRDFTVIVHWQAKRGYGVAWRVLDAQYFGVPQRRRRVFVVASFGNGSASEVLFERECSERDITARGQKRQDITGTLDRKSASSNRRSQYNEYEFIVPFIMAHGQANAEIVSDGSPSLTRNHEAPILWEANTPDGCARISKYGIVPTLNTMGGENRQPLIGVRRLTPLECERLQGFPDGWTDGQSDSARYKQLGNAVAVPVVEWIMRRIAEVE